MVKARSLEVQPPNLVKNTYDFIEDIRANKAKYSSKYKLAEDSDTVHSDFSLFNSDSYKSAYERMRKYKFEQAFYRLESSLLVKRYFDKVGILSMDPLMTRHIKAKEMDSRRPPVFYDSYTLSKPIMIRSYNSKDLNRSSNLV